MLSIGSSGVYACITHLMVILWSSYGYVMVILLFSYQGGKVLLFGLSGGGNEFDFVEYSQRGEVHDGTVAGTSNHFFGTQEYRSQLLVPQIGDKRYIAALGGSGWCSDDTANYQCGPGGFGKPSDCLLLEGGALRLGS